MQLFLEEKGGLVTLVLTITLGLAISQDTTLPVCLPPAPICRSYEALSCEWALNMVSVYVCRTDLISILGIGGSHGYQPRPPTVMYTQPAFTQPTYTQPIFTQPSVYPTYEPPQPQPAYTTFTNRQPAQYTTRMAPQFVETNGQPATGSQPGAFTSRVPGQGFFQGAAREAPLSSAQTPAPVNSGYGQRSSGTPTFQGSSQQAPATGSSQTTKNAQPSYPGGQAVISEEAE